MKPTLFVLLAAAAIAPACGSGPGPTGPEDGPQALARVGEYFAADLGPADSIAVYHIPKDTSGAYRPEAAGLYTLRRDGTGKTLLVLDTEVGAAIENPAWSPDGGWIAFRAAGQLYKVRREGGPAFQLTTSETSKMEFSWSPDGAWIVYNVVYGSGENRGLWIVSANGETERPLRKPPETQRCLGCPAADSSNIYGPGIRWQTLGPTWSARGNEIAYVGSEQLRGNVHLAVYDTTAAQVTFIYSHISTLHTPRFSPDGTRILFVSSPSSASDAPRLGVIRRDGTGLRWIADEVEQPRWSTDGRKVLFRRISFDPERYQGPGYGELWMMNPDGSGKQQITYSLH